MELVSVSGSLPYISGVPIAYFHLVACLAVPYFSTLSHKAARFSGEKICKGYVLILATTFV
jgi:hypothetical protein